MPETAPVSDGARSPLTHVAAAVTERGGGLLVCQRPPRSGMMAWNSPAASLVDQRTWRQPPRVNWPKSLGRPGTARIAARDNRLPALRVPVITKIHRLRRTPECHDWPDDHHASTQIKSFRWGTP
jgi:hypothetical protein